MIQASSEDEFTRMAVSITEEHSEYCECCGERWSIYYTDKPTKVPSINNESVYEYDSSKSWNSGGSAILYHYDGKRERVKLR